MQYKTLKHLHLAHERVLRRNNLLKICSSIEGGSSAEKAEAELKGAYEEAQTPGAWLNDARASMLIGVDLESSEMHLKQMAFLGDISWREYKFYKKHRATNKYMKYPILEDLLEYTAIIDKIESSTTQEEMGAAIAKLEGLDSKYGEATVTITSAIEMVLNPKRTATSKSTAIKQILSQPEEVVSGGLKRYLSGMLEKQNYSVGDLLNSDQYKPRPVTAQEVSQGSIAVPDTKSVTKAI